MEAAAEPHRQRRAQPAEPRNHPGHRLLAEGVPRRRGTRAAAVSRHAPLLAHAHQVARRDRGGDPRPAPAAAVRADEVRHVEPRVPLPRRRARGALDAAPRAALPGAGGASLMHDDWVRQIGQEPDGERRPPLPALRPGANLPGDLPPARGRAHGDRHPAARDRRRERAARDESATVVTGRDGRAAGAARHPPRARHRQPGGAVLRPAAVGSVASWAPAVGGGQLSAVGPDRLGWERPAPPVRPRAPRPAPRAVGRDRGGPRVGGRPDQTQRGGQHHRPGRRLQRPSGRAAATGDGAAQPGGWGHTRGHVRVAGRALSAIFSAMSRTRLDPSIFHLPVDRMREGYYSDKYFVRARDLLLKDKHRPCVTMQVFGKAHAFLGGIDEAIAILKLCSMDWSEVQVTALYDGDEIEPWETVLLIEGPYDAFAHLETLYLGVLARRTKVGTNTRRVVEAAKPKQVMFFPARHDHWLVQTGDGYAAHIAGAIGVSTDAQASWWGSEGVGTVPHALIAAYGGDTVLASQKFAELMDGNMRLITLVDFETDCVGTALKVARGLGERLYGVRIDTSETLVDKSVIPQMGTFKPTGVNPQLVWNVRRALDGEGFQHVKIVVSGGFTVEKIRQFEEQEVPVDM